MSPINISNAFDKRMSCGGGARKGGNMSRRIVFVVAALLPATLATHAFAQAGAGPAPQVQVLSSSPKLVTGGDALLRIGGAAAAPVVHLAVADISSAFKQDATGGWVGLVTGLKDGDNQVNV